MKTKFMRICFIRMSRLGSRIVFIENMLDRKKDKNNSIIWFLLFTTHLGGTGITTILWFNGNFYFMLLPLLNSKIACVIKMQSHSDHIIDKALKLAVNSW